MFPRLITEFVSRVTGGLRIPSESKLLSVKIGVGAYVLLYEFDYSDSEPVPFFIYLSPDEGDEWIGRS